MPELYCDWWWEDLPERAKAAAKSLGWNKESWDADEKVMYDEKAFEECTNAEKRAARYLGMDPVKRKLDIWWEDTDPETQKQALVIGYDQHTWDEDYMIEDLPCEDWWWKDLTDEQKAAARYFGYSRATWDYTDEDDDDEEGAFGATAGHYGADAAAAAPSKTHGKKNSETSKPKKNKKDDDADSDDSAEDKDKKAAKKKNFSVSHPFGNMDGGEPFNHGNHRSIESIKLRGDGHAVHQISIAYFGGKRNKEGSDHGKEQSLELQDGEYIKSVMVRSNKLVQELTFKTNKNNSVHSGGKGWILPGMDHEGKVEEVRAPAGCQLCGLQGRAGKYIDAIAFRWGPLPGKKAPGKA